MGKINDRLLDETLAHALFVSRYSTGVARRMVKILDQADAELSSKLLMALEDVDPQSFTVRRPRATGSDVARWQSRIVGGECHRQSL